MRRKRRERLRSGFGHEEGFDVENASYEDDYDDEGDEEEMDGEDGEKMLQIARIGSDIRSKEKSSHRSHRHNTREGEKTVSDTA